jgi:hypothetical protein
MQIENSNTQITSENMPVLNNVLSAGFLFKIGDFNLVLDEENGDLKISVNNQRSRLMIKPNSDNSCTLLACL